jgi:thiopeptide-type bacteriocin biosynthesis protein
MPADHLSGHPATASEARWFHASISFPAWDAAEPVMATKAGPALDALTRDGRTGSWWFLRKHPHWRIRIRDTPPELAADLLGKLAADGTIAGWHPGIYEPEAHAFGGTAGMDIAHDLFCADSRGVLEYAHGPAPLTGRRELSVALIGALLAAAGLDWFERGDVYARVAAMRPTPPAGSEPQLDQLSGQLRALARVPAELLVLGGMPGAVGTQWLEAFHHAGRQLGAAAQASALERGLRAVLAHVVIFHWNRLGLSATTQGILAHAARDAYLPRD